jgi:hypothetical protein
LVANATDKDMDIVIDIDTDIDMDTENHMGREEIIPLRPQSWGNAHYKNEREILL